MKAITHNKLMALWFKMWEMFDHFLLRFDPDKIKEVMTNPTHTFWMRFTEHLLKPLMFVPGAGLKLVKVHNIGSTPTVWFKDLFKGEGVRSSGLLPSMFPEVTEHQGCNRILEFAPNSNELSDEFLRRFLGTSEDRSQLPGTLLLRNHLMSSACVDEILLRGELYGLQLNALDRALFFVQGRGETVMVISVEFTDGKPLLNTNGGSSLSLDLRWATRIFIADPRKTIPDSMVQS